MRYTLTAVIAATLIAGAVILLPDGARAHEHWIDVESFHPAVGETLEVYVSSGHYFPKSSHVLEAKVVDGLRVWTGSEEPLLLDTVVRDKMRVAVLVVEAEGVHVINLTLKRPRAKRPSYEAKALVMTSSAKDSSASYEIGRGLELIPQQALSEVRPGDKIPIVLSLDGERVNGSLEVVPEHGEAAFINTDVDTPALIPLRNAGKYLVTAHAAGCGCSLVFEVLEGTSKGRGKAE
jgi:hypothetical protein